MQEPQLRLRWRNNAVRQRNADPPSVANFDGIGEAMIAAHDDPDAFRHAVIDHFAGSAAVFELRCNWGNPYATLTENASKR